MMLAVIYSSSCSLRDRYIVHGRVGVVIGELKVFGPKREDIVNLFVHDSESRESIRPPTDYSFYVRHLIFVNLRIVNRMDKHMRFVTSHLGKHKKKGRILDDV